MGDKLRLDRLGRPTDGPLIERLIASNERLIESNKRLADAMEEMNRGMRSGGLLRPPCTDEPMKLNEQPRDQGETDVIPSFDVGSVSGLGDA